MNTQKNEMRVHGTQVIETPITDAVPPIDVPPTPSVNEIDPSCAVPLLLFVTEKMLKNRPRDLCARTPIKNKKHLEEALKGGIYLDRSRLVTKKATYKLRVDSNDVVTFESNPDALTDFAIIRILAKQRGISLDDETCEVSQKDVILYRENHKKEVFTIDSLVL